MAKVFAMRWNEWTYDILSILHFIYSLKTLNIEMHWHHATVHNEQTENRGLARSVWCICFASLWKCRACKPYLVHSNWQMNIFSGTWRCVQLFFRRLHIETSDFLTNWQIMASKHNALCWKNEILSCCSWCHCVFRCAYVTRCVKSSRN